MKKLLVLFFILFSVSTFSQVAQPAMLWLKGIGGSGSSSVSKTVTPTNDGGFIISIGTNAAYGTGNIDSFCALSGGRAIFVKYNADASIQEWSKCFFFDGDTSLSYIFPTNDNGFVLGGTYLAGWGFYICKQDALGNIVWSHGYSKGTSLGLTSMTTTNDGGYLMAGGSYYTDTNIYVHYGSWTDADIFVIKLDSNGNKLWAKVIGGTNDDIVTLVIKGPNNGSYIVGYTSSNDFDCIGNHGGNDVYIARLDENGNILWHKDFGGMGNDASNYVIQNDMGGVIIAAHSSSIDGDITHHIGSGENIWIVSVDSSGGIIWDSCYGGGGYESPNSICRATDGSIWIAGISSAKGGDVDTSYTHGDAWFVHIDSIGRLINTKVLGSSSDDRGTMIYPLSNGHVLGGGFFMAHDGVFSSTSFYGGEDVFLVEFGPLSENIEQIIFAHNQIKIYPNPSKNYVTVEPDRQGTYHLVVTDIVGKEILNEVFTNSLQIDINKWHGGIYCLKITDDNGYFQIQKLLVQ